MSQSRLMSLVESSVNVLIGYLVSVLANWFVLPAFGYPVSVSDSFLIGAVFTVISLVRSYTIRRLFVR